MARFAHLHGHTQYSLLDGLCKTPLLAKHVKANGMDAVAITDHGVMYGAIEFYKSCIAEGVKPIIGCEMYVAPRSHKHKEGKVDTEPFHLTVLAKNLQGYQNLMKLVSIAHLDGFYYKPRVDKELLKQFHEGLICLSGCPGGEFIKNLSSDDFSKSEQIAKDYLEIFGEGNYFLELQSHPYDKYLAMATEENIKRDLERIYQIQKMSFKAAKDISKKLGIPIVATNDFHYIKKEDAAVQDAMLCVQTGKQLTDINRLRMIDSPDYFVKTPEEMLANFGELPDAVEQSARIADMVDLELKDLGKSFLPQYEPPDKKTPADYLREMTYQGAAEKIGEITPEVKERLEYELEIIIFKGYDNYFLIVSDFIQWAHTQKIITNTRGSAAGSLVLYCLGVTNLNPLDYLIPFERFLTKFRPSLPDIDADIADDRRDDVIRYVMSKYGEDRVAHIVTFGTMMGRAAIRDVGRVMGLDYGIVDRIAKLVPPPHQGFHKSLAEAIKEVPELTDVYSRDPQMKKLLDMAVQLEGTVRQASVHAAGIVIAPEEITHFTPLQREANGDKMVAQYDMFSIMDEYGGAGLVKFDFLGIRNLSILGRAVEFVKEDKDIDVDLDRIPLDDKKTYELLSRGETMGVFQLSSDGMTKNLMELRPTRIQDLAAMVALYRPGPMGVIPEYIARKRNPASITYHDPRMKAYLEQSLGLLVYQDDVMLTSIHIAGYSWEEADKFRKAMGKKKPEEMAKQRTHFIEGSVANGLTQQKAEELFALIAPFAAYGFNKAHAASYAMVAYQTAYMKANFPVEFMAAVMTAEYGDTEKIAQAIEECKKMGIVVLPPDVNKSRVGFTLESLEQISQDDLKRQLTAVEQIKAKQGIRFGLSAIKNVGISAIESIIKAREEKPFEHLSDICHRIDGRLANRKTLESLIKAGALDKFGSRAAQMMCLEECIQNAHKQAKKGLNGQTSLFDDIELAQSIPPFTLVETDELPMDQILQFEKDLLGFYLHEPFYLKHLRRLKDFFDTQISQVDDSFIGRRIALAGVIMEVKKVLTKKDSSEMAFVKLSDGVSNIDSVIFPKLYATHKQLLVKEQMVIIWGRIDKREESLSFVADNIEEFDTDKLGSVEIRQGEVRMTGSLEIEVPRNSANGDVLKLINQTLRQYPGNAPISLIIPSGNTLQRMDLGLKVTADAQLIGQIEKIIGTGTVKVI